MKKMLIALLVVTTICWYAPAAKAEPHHGHRSSGHGGHHGGYHGGHDHGHHRSHGYHGYHRPHGHSYYHGPYYQPYYRPYVQPYCVEPVPYNGIELYGERGGFSLFW